MHAQECTCELGQCRIIESSNKLNLWNEIWADYCCSRLDSSMVHEWNVETPWINVTSILHWNILIWHVVKLLFYYLWISFCKNNPNVLFITFHCGHENQLLDLDNIHTGEKYRTLVLSQVSSCNGLFVSSQRTIISQ